MGRCRVGHRNFERNTEVARDMRNSFCSEPEPIAAGGGPIAGQCEALLQELQAKAKNALELVDSRVAPYTIGVDDPAKNAVGPTSLKWPPYFNRMRNMIADVDQQLDCTYYVITNSGL